MSAPPPSPDDDHEAGHYEIRLKGHLDARWAAWLMDQASATSATAPPSFGA